MLNNNDFYTVHQNRERNTRRPPSSFIFSFHPPPPAPVPKLTSLMHEPIARHCGGIQHQPTTCSIKYGGMAFKAMLNAPDMGERESRTCSFCQKGGSERGAHERGEAERNCWEEYCNFQIITLPLWFGSNDGRLVAYTDLDCVSVCV